VYPNLKLQLWKTGIRQNRLARLLGVDETVLSRIVNGFREPNVDLQVRIAEVLQCDPKWLFEAQEEAALKIPAGIAAPLHES
jgi:transcriptional regulator with XRE-family HTH domain